MSFDANNIVSRETSETYICADCPRACGVIRSRSSGDGFCGFGSMPVLARAALHFDEEPVISGTSGTGAVFFSGCSLRCRYCQNYPISHEGFGAPVTIERLREIYLELIDQGAKTIDLVNPTHFARAVYASLEQPLPVPVIWNSGGYDHVETLKSFEGKIRVYLPDLKYMDRDSAARYSSAPDYFDVASKALLEMYRQAGPVRLDDDGIITSGLIIRHLVLPGRAEESCRILDWIHEHLPDAWVSLMAQYLPFGDVAGLDELDRPLKSEEYDMVFDHMVALGMENGFAQELSASDESYIPTFDLTGVQRKA